MNSEKLSEAIGEIDDDIIKEVDEMRSRSSPKNRKRLWISIGTIAACAVISAVAVVSVNMGKLSVDNPNVSGDTSVASQTEPTLPQEQQTTTISQNGQQATTASRTEQTTTATTTSGQDEQSVTTSTTEPTTAPQEQQTTVASKTEQTTMPVEPVEVVMSKPTTENLELMAAEYPDIKEPDYEEENWATKYRKYQSAMNLLQSNLKYTKDISKSYYSSVTETFLSNANGENAIISPVNIYLALSMLAETTDGNSRQQILNLLGAESIGQVRLCANGLWGGCFSNTLYNRALLGNSIWLSNKKSYNLNTLQTLADNYYASTYIGAMGSDSYNEMLREWINSNTGGLLQDEVSDVKLSYDAAFALVSTVYYDVQWEDDFYSKLNTEGIFTSANGNEQQAEFMNTTFYSRYYDGGNFIASYKGICGNNRMWFILPDEGTTAEQLIQSGALSEFLYGGGKDNLERCECKLSLPKFDVTVQNDLIDGLSSLGITDIFDSDVADFSAIGDEKGRYVDKIDNAVRVMVDEKGVSATSYVLVEAVDGAADEEQIVVIDMKLDRPFIFAIENSKGLILFCGIVNTLQ